MAIELITGRAGAPHVDSADVGAFNAAMFGSGVYIVKGASVAPMTEPNHVTINAGELLCEGRHIRITGAGETLAIDNGQSGYKRNDIIAIHYERNSNDIEACSLVVVKGTQAADTAQDPPMPSSGKLSEGASSVYWPLYRIVINELTPQTPERIIDQYPAFNVTEGALPVASGGTGRTSIENIRANLDSTTAANPLSGNIGVTGTLPVANGGTGATTAAAARTNLGIGAIGTKASLAAADIPSISTDKLTSGTLPIARGGTGATTAATARTNLGLGTGATISPSDYIVDKGISGSAFYIKWNSGNCLIVAKTTLASACTTAWGGMYEGSMLQISWPFTLTAQAYEIGQISGSGNASLTEIGATSDATTTKSRKYNQIRPTTSNSQTITATVFAFGKWK